MFASKAKEWRKHPDISPWTNFKACFTGFGTALALFTGYSPRRNRKNLAPEFRVLVKLEPHVYPYMVSKTGH
ncbi:hypothetical protein GAYE_PCTG10G0390 [Galdieria yellowstonensis]|uniref:Uncharacterized protein n=1 Tax=Galdieria yellowstonensis TaxID=3028027 RepID=A0AAV9I7V0_9RHOD|nr:hypothetical protein GAYE_PCTG10G0390 [Galdieria yellowstonensis]